MGGNELPVSLVSCFEIALFHNIIFINFNFLCLQFFFFFKQYIFRKWKK